MWLVKVGDVEAVEQVGYHQGGLCLCCCFGVVSLGGSYSVSWIRWLLWIFEDGVFVYGLPV